MAEENIPPLLSNSNFGEIKTDPLLSVPAAAKSLEISQSLGIKTDPVMSFKPDNSLEVDLAPDAIATRSVANESDEAASLIKPDAKKLSTLEKYNENLKIQMQTQSLQDENTKLIFKQMQLRDKGQDLSEDELIQLDARELQMEELEERRKGFDLTTAEGVLTGTLPSVFRDMYVAGKEHPVTSTLSLLGFLGGPAVGALTVGAVNSASLTNYNYERTKAKTYRDLEKFADAQGNPLPHDLKMGIANLSSGVQAVLEGASEVVLKKTSTLWNGPKIAGRIAQKALSNPTFRNKLIDFSTRSGTAAITEGVTEVLQDMVGDYTESTGATWSKDTGINITAAAEKFAQDFDAGKYGDTFVTSALTGGAVIGVTDTVAGGFSKGKKAYQNLTGKKIELGPNDTVVEAPAEQPKMNNLKFNVPATPEQLAEQEQAAPPTGPYIMKDGVPVYLTAQEAILLGHIMPNIESIRGYNIGENAIATELLQQREAEKNGINQIFIDKEKLNEWADNSEKKQAVARLFVGERGAYLDAQKVPLTREEYYSLHGFGNTEFLTDNTAITSTGMTLGDLKQLVKEKAPKDIPKADNIPASPEQNTAGDINLATDGNIPATSDLGVHSSIEEVTQTLKTKPEADAYLSRLKEAETVETTPLMDSGADFVGIEERLKSIKPETYTLPNGSKLEIRAEMNEITGGREALNMGKDQRGNFAPSAVAYIDGKKVGYVAIGGEFKDGKFITSPTMVEVNEDSRRQGVASALYDFANNRIAKFESSQNQTEDGKAFTQGRKKTQSDRSVHIKEMQERVNAIRNELPDFIPAPEVDDSIKDFESFGDVTENVFAVMTPTEQKQYTDQITKAKTDMKRNFKSNIISEYDQVASLQERELNAIAQDEVINEIMSDENITIVEAFMGDKSLRIDPETLSDSQRSRYVDSFLINDRKAFKKNGMHIEEVAAQMGVTSEKLLETLDNSPTLKQAYATKTKLEEARNKKIAADNTEINTTAIESTIDDVVGLKKKMLNNILKADPRAGLRLIHSLFKAGSKTAVQNVNINAQETTDNTRIGNLKPSSYLNASRRHMNRANTAINKDQDLSRGAANIEKSMVADELFKAATVTVRKVNQILSRVSTMSRNKALMDKLRATNHYEAFQSLIGMLGQRKLKVKDLNIIKDLMIEWQDKGLESDPNLPANIVQPLSVALTENTVPDINDMSLSQIETINSVIEQLLADNKNEIAQRKQQQVMFDKDVAVVAEQEVADNPYRDGSKSRTYAKGGSGWMKNYLDKVSGFYSTFQSNDDMLDWYKISKDGVIGTMWRQVKGLGIFDNGLGEKGKFELTNKTKNYLASSIGKENQKRLESYAGQYVYVPEWQNSNGLLTSDGKLRKTDMLGMLLIYGQADGRNRLSKYDINVDSIPTVLYKYLDPKDIEIVEAIWKSHDFLKPGIENTEKTLRGVNKVEFVTGEKFMWGNKEVNGGYVHLSYKTDQSVATQARRDQQEIEKALGEDKAFNDNDAARGFTKEGFKKAREKNVDAFVDLDLNGMVDKSLGAIIANNTMLIPIYNTMRILNNPAVAEQYINVMGKEGLKIFKANVLMTGRNSNFDLHQAKSAFAGVARILESSGANFMASKIVGSISSVFNQFLTFGLITGRHIDQNPAVIGKSAFYMMKMMASPKSVNTLIDQMSDHIPAIKTDKTSYQVDNVQSFKLFDKSESGSKIVRAVVNSSEALTEIWLSKIMGGLDTFNKTAYALALLDTTLKGKAKGGPTKAQIAKMTETELLRAAYAHVDENVAKMFPDRRLSSASYVQTHPVARSMVPFFNDARRVMNAFYFPRMRDMIESATMFQRNAAKNGVASAVAKSTKDVVFGLVAMHMYASMVDATLRGLRGEDKEGERDGNQNFFKRWFGIFKKDFIDPWTIAKGVADVMPVVSNVKFFLESDGRAGGVTTPTISYFGQVVQTIYNMYDTKYNDNEWNDKKSRDLVDVISGVTPIPAGPIKNYYFGESTAFQTGLKSAVGLGMIMQAIPEKFKDVADKVVELNPEAIAAETNPNVQQVDQSELENLYRTLLAEPGGRSTLAQYIEENRIPLMSQDEVYNLIFTESNGDPDARNARSGATGVGQFVSKTWNDLKDKHPLELQDISPAYRYDADIPDGEVDGRTDPAQSMVMLERLHKDISIAFVRAGVEPNQFNIYIGHHFGQSAAIDFIKAKDSEKVKAVYGNNDAWEIIQEQNPWIRDNMTVGQFKDQIEYLLISGADKQLKWEEENGPYDPFNLPTR